MSQRELRVDDFDVFFEAVHGHQPFRWQRRLLDHLVRTGAFPDSLNLPTGSGKTALIDIAVFAMALGLPVPRRVVFVVDRRVIVHQAANHARRIAEVLDASEHPVVGTVRDKLRALAGATDDPTPALHTVELRGGIPRDESWALRPDQPAVIASTVDQAGSRLLFRGYGVSDRMRPVLAGLLGNDTLFVLDEVHLTPAFADLLAAIRQRYRPPESCGLPDRWQVVELTATPSRAVSNSFGLTEDDQADPVLTRRLRAHKPAELRMVPTRRNSNESELLAAGAVDAVLAMVDDPYATTIGVILNRVDTARRVHQLLETSHADQVEAVLLTGRMRPFDRDDLLTAHENRLALGRERPAQPTYDNPVDERQPKPLVLVSTQAIEAGADFDLDALVTECAALDALKQRFGRVDRDGRLTEICEHQHRMPPRSVILAGKHTLATADEPIYGTALAATWQWLTEQTEQPDQELDFGTAWLPDPGERRDGLSPLRKPGPLLFDTQMDSWVSTWPIPDVDPDIALWLHARPDPDTDVTLIWRADLTEQGLLAEPTRPGQEPTGLPPGSPSDLGELARSVVAACPPGVGEAMQVPLAAVRAWLTQTPDQPDVSDTETPITTSPLLRGRIRPALQWSGDDTQIVHTSNALRPGDTLIVPATYGGVHAGTWDPDSSAPVADLAHRVEYEQRARATLRLLPTLLDPHLPEPPEPAVDDPDVDHHATVTAWLSLAAQQIIEPSGETLDAAPTSPDITRAILHHLDNNKRDLRIQLIDTDGQRTAYYVATSAIALGPTTQRIAGRAVPLDQHLDNARRWARQLTQACGLPALIASDVELAAHLHDIGKCDCRLQRVFRDTGTDPGYQGLLAKSGIDPRSRLGRRRNDETGYPEHARHELLTVALIQHQDQIRARAHDWDLVLHLIATHHGYARPFAPIAVDHDPVQVTIEWDGIQLTGTSDHGLDRLDSGIPQRFWKLIDRYGHYGLAWLEAILRLADHRASQEEEACRRTKEDR